jgi:hypothetical protein
MTGVGTRFRRVKPKWPPSWEARNERVVESWAMRGWNPGLAHMRRLEEASMSAPMSEI